MHPSSFLLIGILSATVLQDDAVAILESAPRITVYSLNPTRTREPLFTFKGTVKPSFHGYRILASTDLTGNAKSELLGKLYTAMAEDAQPARCFNPRHGVRAEMGNRVVDLVICFECRGFESYVNGKKGGGTISASPEEHLDGALSKKPVP